MHSRIFRDQRLYEEPCGSLDVHFANSPLHCDYDHICRRPYHLTYNVDMINELKSSLECEFEMSDLGELHFFLCVHFKRNRRSCTITMHQRNYIESILEQFGMPNCKHIVTPLDAKTLLPKLLGEQHDEHLHEMKDVLYQEAVGTSMCIMVATRLDLTFAISMVSWYMSKPG